MKNTILHWTSALLASSALLFNACSSSDEETDGPSGTPVFPDLTTLTIPAGETSCEVSFTPNMDWTASIPTDAETARWFKLSDGVMEEYSISGKASSTPVTIYVTTINQQSFDESPVCEVSLTMGGQTQVIAKITRGTQAREFELYASNYDTSMDDFTIPYVYSETALTKYTGSETSMDFDQAPEGTIELKWPTRVSSFMYVFKAKGNFSWLISKPEGLEITSTAIEDDPGSYQITVTGDFSEHNLDSYTAVLDFYDKSINPDEDPGNNAHNKYCLRVPGFRDIVRHPFANINATFTFNNEGKYVSNTMGTETISDNLSTSVSSMEGLAFYVAEEIENVGYVFKQGPAQWVTIADTWNSELDDLFQEHDYTVTVTPNETGAARSAKLIALPKSLADELPYPAAMLEGMTDFKAEYKPYVYATIEQSGPDAGGSDSNVISISANADVSAFDNQIATFKSVDGSYFSQHPNASLDEVKAAYEEGIPVYELTYNSNSPASNFNAVLDINIEMGADDKITSSESAEWLGTTIMPPMFVVDMEVVKANKGDMGYIALKKNDTIFAYLICVRNFGPVIAISTSGADVSAFEGDNPTATLNSVNALSYFSKYPEGTLDDVKTAYSQGTPVFELTYNSNSPFVNSNAVLDINPERSGEISASESAEWLHAELIDTMMVVNMDAASANKGDVGYIAFYQNDMIFAYLICIRNFESTNNQ